MAQPLAQPREPPTSDRDLRVPSAAHWAAMSEAEKQALEQRIYAALNADVWAMSESTRHFRPKANAYKDLDDHFDRTGRRVFLACELAVLYPGEDPIVPDLLAVVDIADPERDRDSWRVADEGRGIDFILELRNKGKPQKDLGDNVRDYARLRIPEYFAFDCQKRVLRGFRLPDPSASAYVPILPQGSRFPSLLLDLELAVIEGSLRFFIGHAMVPSSRELIGRLQQMVDAQQRSIEEAERELQQAYRQVAEQVLLRLTERAIPVSEAQRQAILPCQDMTRLLSWLEQARTAASAEDLLREDGPK